MKEKFGLARMKTYVLGRGLQDAPIEMAQIKSA